MTSDQTAGGEEGGFSLEPVHLVIRDREFNVRHVPIWLQMKLMRAYLTDQVTAYAEMVGFLRHLVTEEDWPELDAYLSTLDDLAFTELDQAIGGAIAGLAGRGKATPPSSSSSSGGSSETPPTRRVVSLSRGTVREDEADDTTSSRKSG